MEYTICHSVSLTRRSEMKHITNPRGGLSGAVIALTASLLVWSPTQAMESFMNEQIHMVKIQSTRISFKIRRRFQPEINGLKTR